MYMLCHGHVHNVHVPYGFNVKKEERREKRLRAQRAKVGAERGWGPAVQRLRRSRSSDTSSTDEQATTRRLEVIKWGLTLLPDPNL